MIRAPRQGLQELPRARAAAGAHSFIPIFRGFASLTPRLSSQRPSRAPRPIWENTLVYL